MKVEGIEIIPSGGLKVSTAVFTRLKAFQGGGDYWDQQALIRESLGQILPPVQQVLESGISFGVFHRNVASKETLCKSKPVGAARIPENEIRRLESALEVFKKKADDPDTQHNAKAFIQQFQLPDITKDPDLYRLCGPWWNRKLQVLWGCERMPDSSVTPLVAISKLPIDKAYNIRRFVGFFSILLLVCALIAACVLGWPVLKRWSAMAFNNAPVAALRLDSVDETNRIASVSDNGSKDPDGVLKSWHIAWGDGQENDFTEAPKQARHCYKTERDYTITFWCVDNYGATSSPPVHINVTFSLLKRLKAFDQAQLDAKRESDQIKDDAKKEADQIKEEAKKEADRIKNEAITKQALADQESAREKHDKEVGGQKLKEAEDATVRSKTNTPSVALAMPTNNLPRVNQDLRPAPQSTERPATNSQPGEFALPEPLGETPSNAEPVKGGQRLMFSNLEILKAGVGQLKPDKTLEAILLVRDKSHPNAPLDILEWVVDGKAYHTGNAQFTSRVAVGDHMVGVRVRNLGSQQTIKARVVVTGTQTQTTEPNFTVFPLR